MNDTQELIRQMKRVTFTRAMIFKLKRTLERGGLSSSCWDYQQAIIRERFHLRVERTTLRFMRNGTDHRSAYRRALQYHNPSIRR